MHLPRVEHAFAEYVLSGLLSRNIKHMHTFSHSKEEKCRALGFKGFGFGAFVGPL
jgi:hypothetical protein